MDKTCKQVSPGPREAPPEPRTDLVSLRCTFCHDGLGRDLAVFCAACLAPHHADCRREHGACAGPGCAETRTVRPADARRRRRLLWTSLAVGLLLAGALGLSSSAPAGEAVQPRPPVALPAEPTPPPVTTVDSLSRFVDVSFVASGFELPVSLGSGQRLLVSLDEDGFTQVYLCPPPGADSWVYGKTLLVADPGDTVQLRCPTGVWPLEPTAGCALEVLATDHTPPQIEVNARLRH